MNFVSRAEWGAKYARGSGPIPGPIRGVTLHWEGPKMGSFPHSACAGKVRVVERFHAVTRGWAGIAYSAIVCPHGYVFEGRGPGVRSAANGTSSIGGNDQWYAVCYMSGQGDGFTAAGKAGMVAAVQWLRANGGAGDRVIGHRDHHPTACPGDEIYAWLQRANFGATTPTPKDWFDMADKTDLRTVVDAAIDAKTDDIAAAAVKRLLGTKITDRDASGKAVGEETVESKLVRLEALVQRVELLVRSLGDAGKA